MPTGPHCAISRDLRLGRGRRSRPRNPAWLALSIAAAMCMHAQPAGADADRLRWSELRLVGPRAKLVPGEAAPQRPAGATAWYGAVGAGYWHFGGGLELEDEPGLRVTARRGRDRGCRALEIGLSLAESQWRQPPAGSTGPTGPGAPAPSPPQQPAPPSAPPEEGGATEPPTPPSGPPPPSSAPSPEPPPGTPVGSRAVSTAPDQSALATDLRLWQLSLAVEPWCYRPAPGWVVGVRGGASLSRLSSDRASDTAPGAFLGLSLRWVGAAGRSLALVVDRHWMDAELGGADGLRATWMGLEYRGRFW